MAASKKYVRPKNGISEAVVDRAIKALKLKTKRKYEDVVKKVIWRRLNDIHARFSDPESYRKAPPPAKTRNSLKVQHKTIIKTLKILRSLNGEDETTRLLFGASEIGGVLSAGLVGYDVFLDKSVLTAISALEKVEGYYSDALEKAKLAVKRKGETKAGNPYADNLLGHLCWLYRDITGEPPKASVDDAKGVVRGNIVKFLMCVLPAFPYTGAVTSLALEKRLRKIKHHEMYAILWEDTKR